MRPKHILLFIVFSFSIGLATGQIAVVYDHPEAADIKTVKPLTQPDGISCGPTSVCMVLNHYHKKAEFEAVSHKLRTRWFRYDGQDVGMTSPDQIPKVLADFGVPARYDTSGRVEKLKHYVSRNRPPIVLLRSGQKTWHYCVVVAYGRDNFILADPALGDRRQIALASFLTSWSFQSDIDGAPVTATCAACSGSGQWFKGFGPLGTCWVCNGTGNSPDVYLSLLRGAEVSPRTMILPTVHN